MNILIKKAKIVDPGSDLNGKVMDVLIKDGIITSIENNINDNDAKVIEFKNAHISPGWFDMHCYLRDPGFEHKEDLESGIKAAAFGGFTEIACMPATNPPLHTKSEIQYIKNKTRNAVVEVHPIGALSQNLEGKEIAEMFDMFQSGAVAFSDGKKSVTHSGLLSRALLYTKGFNGLVINFPDDQTISKGGMMNEGVVSTSLGLKGIPALAEELMISRDVFLTEYTEGRLHFATISSARSVELIREAKKRGLNITAEVSAYHISIDDTLLNSFDSNYKVKPPLRTQTDITALIEGLKDGTIDVIVSDHTPQDVESKVREFDHANFGITNLETAFAVANSVLTGKISLEKIIAKISINPRKILNLPQPKIEKGASANLTIFDPELHWTFEEKDIKSKSRNTPFVGTKFTGKALGIVNKGQFVVS